MPATVATFIASIFILLSIKLLFEPIETFLEIIFIIVIFLCVLCIYQFFKWMGFE